MKIKLLIVFVLLANVVLAQDFEGTIKWSMKMDITDPKLKAQMEEAERKMQDPATQAQMKQAMEKMNDPQFKKNDGLQPAAQSANGSHDEKYAGGRFHDANRYDDENKSWQRTD